VHGAILTEYLIAAGGPAVYGLPLTDETTTPDGVGRFNHFQGGRSIYWTPATGAHAVYGAIRAAWAARGWERGPVGSGRVLVSTARSVVRPKADRRTVRAAS